MHPPGEAEAVGAVEAWTRVVVAVRMPAVVVPVVKEEREPQVVVAGLREDLPARQPRPNAETNAAIQQRKNAGATHVHRLGHPVIEGLPAAQE